MSINDILLEIASDQSRLFKEAVLKRNENNELLKQVIFLALDPFTNFHIKKIPNYDFFDITQEEPEKISLEEALKKLDHLSSRKVTGNAAVNHLRYILSSLSDDDAEVVIKIIRRDLRCGVSDSTVNKVWPELIFTYPCLLCSPYDVKTVKKLNWPVIGQIKEDGLRFNAVVDKGTCLFFSRKGQPIEILDQSFYDEFILLADGQSVVFDGELVAYRDNKLLPRKESNGIANKAIKGTITEDESKMFQAVLWDEIPLSDFKASACPIQYEDRLNSLVSKSMLLYSDEYKIISELKNGFKRIEVAETFICDTLEDAQSKFQSYLNQKREGIILKNKSSLWSDTRSREQIKLKAEQECDLRVIEWNFGEVGTKNEFRLGSLLCSSEDGKVVVNVSGFSDDERDTITRDNSLNKIVSILYNERITKKNGGPDSLFLPRIVEFRTDKTVADTSNLIK